ncbi:hypothetical protein FRC11_012726, partial [Ceratobasidium sp. 423]
DLRSAAAKKCDSQQHSHMIKKKRAQSTSLSSPARSVHSVEVSLSDEIPPTSSKSDQQKTQNASKGKGKASLATQMHQILSPIDKQEAFPSLAMPRPRPASTGDQLFDNLEIEEWKLLWYLSICDNYNPNPHADYSELKSVLGADQEWDSDDEALDSNVLERRAPANVANVNKDFGEFDDEPKIGNPVQVRAITVPESTQPQVSNLQNQPLQPLQANMVSHKHKSAEVVDHSPLVEQEPTHLAPKSNTAQSAKHHKSGLVIQKSAPRMSHSHGGAHSQLLSYSLASGSQGPVDPLGFAQSQPLPHATSSSSVNPTNSSQRLPGTSTSNLGTTASQPGCKMSVPPHGSSQCLPPASGNPSVLSGFPASRHPSEALRHAQSTAPSASCLAPLPPSSSQAPCCQENSMVPPPLPYQHGYRGSSVAPLPPFPQQNSSRRPSVPPPPPPPLPSQPSNQHPGRGQFNKGHHVDRGPNQGRGPQPGSTSGAQRHNGTTDRSCTVSTATTASSQSRRQQPQQGAVGNPGPEDGNAQQVWQGEDVMPDGQGDQGNAGGQPFYSSYW